MYNSDILWSVLKQLTPYEIIQTRKICKFWLKIALHPQLWATQFHLEPISWIDMRIVYITFWFQINQSLFPELIFYLGTNKRWLGFFVAAGDQLSGLKFVDITKDEKEATSVLKIGPMYSINWHGGDKCKTFSGFYSRMWYFYKAGILFEYGVSLCAPKHLIWNIISFLFSVYSINRKQNLTQNVQQPLLLMNFPRVIHTISDLSISEQQKIRDKSAIFYPDFNINSLENKVTKMDSSVVVRTHLYLDWFKNPELYQVELTLEPENIQLHTIYVAKFFT